MNIAGIRSEYMRATLDEREVARDPFAQFSSWFEAAVKAELPGPNAMCLATADAAGAPDARIVLLKGFDSRGFVFYTNTLSRKGRELAANPRASLLFFWGELERQVRIEGRVQLVSPAEADEYYRSRPLGARIGAWASPQSEVLPARAELEATIADLTRKLGDDPQRPPHWSGYRVAPHAFEFWQGRASRLHDRVRYRGATHGSAPGAGQAWIIERLAP
ncbi:MAG: pyridoxamine 5'-phosphate oxidase [Betaproteobacteria bacterium]|nr:pyridoxamine 5'-phosphate oxidase [Betaproteobacteria bacterium]